MAEKGRRELREPSGAPRFDLLLLLIAMALVPLGIGTKLYAGPLQHWVHAHAGGVIYVSFWCLLVLALWPRLSPALAAGAVLLVTFALECLQLWHPPVLEAVRSTFVGHALIGSAFSWADFPHYIVGALAALGIVKLRRG